MSNILPIVRLQQVLRAVSRPESVNPEKTYQILGAHWYGTGLFVKDVKFGAQIQASTVYRVEEGDFVYNRLFAWKGSFAVATRDNAGCYVSNEFPCFQTDETRLDPFYLWYYFRQEKVWGDILELSTGSTSISRNRLKEAELLALEIPLPPLDEQRRIVAHIDAVAEQITAARGLRHGAVEQSEALLNAVKNDVFSDEYVASFSSISLGDVSDIQSGVTLGRKLVGDTVSLPYLRVANVQDGYLDLNEIKEVEVLASEFDKWQLQFGDILLTEGGDWDKLGRGTVWQDEIPNCIHQNHIFRLRVNLEEFDPHFLMSLISSPRGKRYFQDASKQTTNLASINQRQLKAFQVFCPSLAEQRMIVEEIEEVGRRVAYFRRLQTDTAAELDALLPSLLDRAFRGEL